MVKNGKAAGEARCVACLTLAASDWRGQVSRQGTSLHAALAAATCAMSSGWGSPHQSLQLCSGVYQKHAGTASPWPKITTCAASGAAAVTRTCVMHCTSISATHLCDIDGAACVLLTAPSSAGTLPAPGCVAVAPGALDMARHVSDELLLMALQRPLIPAAADITFNGLPPSPLPLFCHRFWHRAGLQTVARARRCRLGKADAQQQPAGQHEPVHQIEC